MAEPTPEDVDVISVPEWERLGQAFTGLVTKRTHRIVVRREAVPIIFVPGIMGSRLATSKSGRKIWDPDAKIGFMLLKYGMFWVSAKDKKDRLIGPLNFDGKYLRVFEDDAKHNEEYFGDLPHAAARGWGGVSWGTYGGILQLLDSHRWQGHAGKILVAPVYACGYNWSDSAASAGKALQERITKIMEEQRAEGKRCEKVILVTHSMGGLVARSACKLADQGGSPAEGNVLGVVHGVQPTTGAPAAYWRMRGGFERPGVFDVLGRITTFVLGADGEETTALLGNMPGGLQLLPTSDYRANDGGAAWLTVENEAKEVIKALPSSERAPDPYKDIYEERHAPWRLVNPAFLDPEREPAREGKDKEAAGLVDDDPWDNYLEYLREAKWFHGELGLQRHPNTHIFWGKAKDAKKPAHPSADRIELTCGRYVPTSLEMDSGQTYTRGPVLSSTDGLQLVEGFHSWECRGGYKAHLVVRGTRTGYTLEMADPAGSGDGTVPESSGKILESRGAHSNYVHDVEHEPAFKDDYAQEKTLEAIEQMLNELVEQRLRPGGGG